MKKYLIITALAVIIGALFAFYMFKGIDNNINNILVKDRQITVFQSGVFKEENNAVLEKNKYDQAIIIKDGDLYRVYIGVSYDGEVTQAYENYFKKNNYNYYCKKIDVSANYLKNIQQYEALVKKSFNEDTYININKDLLAKLKEELI